MAHEGEGILDVKSTKCTCSDCFGRKKEKLESILKAFDLFVLLLQRMQKARTYRNTELWT